MSPQAIESRREQGFPPHVTDPAVLRKAALILASVRDDEQQDAA